MLLDFSDAGAGNGPPPDAGRLPQRPSLGAARTANPPLATLTETLRGPLVPVIGFAQLLQVELPQGSRAHRYAAEIQISAQELLVVLDALLARAAGRPPGGGNAAAVQQAADDAIAALRQLLAPRTLAEPTDDNCNSTSSGS